MSTNIIERDDMVVTRFCGPEGRRESYQLNDRKGNYAHFTYDELVVIMKAVRKEHKAP